MDFIYFIGGILATILVAYIFRLNLLPLLVKFAEYTGSKKHAKWISNAACKLKNSNKALSLYLRAIELGDDRVLPLFNSSIILAKNKQYDKSLEFIDKAISKLIKSNKDNVKLADAYIHRFSLFFQQEHIDESECESCINNSIKYHPSIDKFINATAYYITTNNLELAKEYIEKVENDEPNNCYNLIHKATILRREGKYDEAYETTLFSYSLSPNLEANKILLQEIVNDMREIEEKGGLPANTKTELSVMSVTKEEIIK